jgi:hypothetical protein
MLIFNIFSHTKFQLPFSSAWKIWLAASTRRGKREYRICDALRARGKGKGGKGRSWAKDEDAKFCLASSTTSVIGKISTIQKKCKRERKRTFNFPHPDGHPSIHSRVGRDTLAFRNIIREREIKSLEPVRK